MKDKQPPKSRLNLFLLMIALISTGLVVGIVVTSSVDSISGPPRKDVEFVRACGELNGKELSLSNISSLKGVCYVSCGKDCVGIRPCKDSDIKQYLQFIKDCPAVLDNTSATTPSVCLNGDLIKCGGPSRDCVQKYWNNTQEGNLNIYWDGSFSVSKGDLDNNWICEIRYNQRDETIKAIPDFVYD